MIPVEIDPTRLVVTPAAAKAIVQIVCDRESALGSGLRITSTGAPPSTLLLSVTKRPHLDDSVLSFDGAALFVEGTYWQALGCGSQSTGRYLLLGHLTDRYGLRGFHDDASRRPERASSDGGPQIPTPPTGGTRGPK